VFSLSEIPRPITFMMVVINDAYGHDQNEAKEQYNVPKPQPNETIHNLLKSYVICELLILLPLY
jgi:hypothetical protein